MIESALEPANCNSYLGLQNLARATSLYDIFHFHCSNPYKPVRSAG